MAYDESEWCFSSFNNIKCDNFDPSDKTDVPFTVDPIDPIALASEIKYEYEYVLDTQLGG